MAAFEVRAHAETPVLKGGWAVAVTGWRNSAGRDKTFHYIAAIEDPDKAIGAVRRIVGADKTLSIAGPVEARMLKLREVNPGEVHRLGEARRSRSSAA